MKLDQRRWFALLIVLAILILPGTNVTFTVSAHSGQKPAQPQCPKANVNCPSAVYVKDTLTFTVLLSGGDAKVSPTYNWSVSAGSIESGQGTSTINVATIGLDLDSTVTATVEAGGYDRVCGYGSTAASCTSSLLKKAEAHKFEEYGKLKPKDEEARLDNFTIELQNEPTAQGYILSYHGSASRPGDAQKTADRAKDYLIRKRGLESSRVVTVTGGHREEPTVELWIVPAGTQPPKPTASAKQ